ncbi:MAG: hypothetical protein HQK84_08055, partial [Nitrospinae bacterium]|nr:hypothetical protein [Nitrospinota bacterium]
RIIAFIRAESEVKKILRNIDEETIRPPPLKHVQPVMIEDVICEYGEESISITEASLSTRFTRIKKR